MDGIVEVIGVAPEAARALEARAEVRLVAGVGIEGDRYAEGKGTFSRKPDPKRQLTLIGAEDVEAAARDAGFEIAPLDPRRNLVVRGMSLAGLIGARFTLGEAEIEILSPCPPCGWLDRVVRPGLDAALGGRGGVYAAIHRGGTVRVGDHLTPVPGHPARRLP
ncbi:MAG: MOSC domain-containing protein [Planctomycetota bacterium]